MLSKLLKFRRPLSALCENKDFPGISSFLRYSSSSLFFLFLSADLLHIIFNTLKFNIMSYEKFYIGKGTQVPNLQIAKVTVKLEEIEKIAYDRDGVKYVTFEVAKLKEPDKFGRTFTCYYSKKVNVAEEPTPQKPSKKGKKEKTNDLPF